jgi:hypothetical protein
MLMPHPLVLQLRFTRSEFRRALVGVSNDDARRRFAPMNCMAWNVGHLAWQEQAYWLWAGQDRMPLPDIDKLFVPGAPASAPALSEMWEAWRAITEAANPWLDTLTPSDLAERRRILLDGQEIEFTVGTDLQRVIYHYWYHTGENRAIRQLLGHTDLPEFVGNIDDEAPYPPEEPRG